MQLLNLPQTSDIENVIISHGHNDHTGGLRSFLEENSIAQITLHKSIKGEKFFSCRPKNTTINGFSLREFRSIGMENSLFIEHNSRFNEIDQATTICKGVTVIPSFSNNKKYPLPPGNSFLYKNDLPDNFSHEIATLVEIDPDKYAVISPCTHNGILNTLEECVEHISRATKCSVDRSREKIILFVGGLHFVDYLSVNEDTSKETQQQNIIKETASTLKKMYPHTRIYSGHCTCKKASEQLSEILGNNYHQFNTGTIIQL